MCTSMQNYCLRSSQSGPSLVPHWKPWTMESFTEPRRLLSTWRQDRIDESKSIYSWWKIPRLLCMKVKSLDVGLVTNSNSISPPPWFSTNNYVVRIWEKGPHCMVSVILFLVVHNFKAVIATVLKSGKGVLQSLCHTHWKVSATPTSWVGVAITIIAKLAALRSFTISDKNIHVHVATLSNGFL